jgi:hypothetical protein
MVRADILLLYSRDITLGLAGSRGVKPPRAAPDQGVLLYPFCDAEV